MTNDNLLIGAHSIGKYIGEDHRRISELKEKEGLPVYRTSGGKKATWKGIKADLDKWIVDQRDKHLPSEDNRGGLA